VAAVKVSNTLKRLIDQLKEKILQIDQLTTLKHL